MLPTTLCHVMHFGIDVREACNPQRTGKGQWTFGFVSELIKRGEELTLFTDTNIPSEWKRSNGVHIPMIHARGLAWHVRVAHEVKNRSAIDMFVAPTSYIVPCLLRQSKKHIIIVHDLIAFRDEPHDRRATIIEKLTLKRAAQTAICVCTISDTTRNDLLQKYSLLDARRVVSIFAASMSDVNHVVHHNGKNIFCLATLCPRKNQERLIRAYTSLSAELQKKHPLILAGGRGWHDDDIVSLAQNTPGVTWKNYVTDEDLNHLFEDASVFVYPSLYEGFGLPILDAMERGLPIVTSNIGSMKEVAYDAAVLVDPLSIESIRDGLTTILTDDHLRASLIQKGKARAKEFSWQKTVDLFLAAAKQN